MTYKLPKSWKQSGDQEGVFQKEENGEVVIAFQVQVFDTPGEDINDKETLDIFLKGIKTDNEA